jgi:hypothetical protein
MKSPAEDGRGEDESKVLPSNRRDSLQDDDPERPVDYPMRNLTREDDETADGSGNRKSRLGA